MTTKQIDAKAFRAVGMRVGAVIGYLKLWPTLRRDLGALRATGLVLINIFVIWVMLEQLPDLAEAAGSIGDQ